MNELKIKIEELVIDYGMDQILAGLVDFTDAIRRQSQNLNPNEETLYLTQLSHNLEIALREYKTYA
jgi:hypothetical protein